MLFALVFAQALVASVVFNFLMLLDSRSDR
jgi:hypothetical protein